MFLYYILVYYNFMKKVNKIIVLCFIVILICYIEGGYSIMVIYIFIICGIVKFFLNYII